MVAEPGAGAGGKRRSLRDKNDVVMIDGDTSGLVVTQIIFPTCIMISKGMVSKGQYSNFGPGKDSEYSILKN